MNKGLGVGERTLLREETKIWGMVFLLRRQVQFGWRCRPQAWPWASHWDADLSESGSSTVLLNTLAKLRGKFRSTRSPQQPPAPAVAASLPHTPLPSLRPLKGTLPRGKKYQNTKPTAWGALAWTLKIDKWQVHLHWSYQQTLFLLGSLEREIGQLFKVHLLLAGPDDLEMTNKVLWCESSPSKKSVHTQFHIYVCTQTHIQQHTHLHTKIDSAISLFGWLLVSF